MSMKKQLCCESASLDLPIIQVAYIIYAAEPACAAHHRTATALVAFFKIRDGRPLLEFNRLLPIQFRTFPQFWALRCEKIFPSGTLLTDYDSDMMGCCNYSIWIWIILARAMKSSRTTGSTVGANETVGRLLRNGTWYCIIAIHNNF